LLDVRNSLFLVTAWVVLGRRNWLLTDPACNDLQVVFAELIQTGTTDKNINAVPQERDDVFGVCKYNPVLNVIAIGFADKGRKFIPGQGRPASAKLALASIMASGLIQVNAIGPVVLPR
jgi:hypothetical protein